MAGKKYYGIYFSAHWCPPCRSFTPKLRDWFAANGAGLDMQIVFVSSDEDEDGFTEYFSEMPWLALPYAERDIQAKLSKKYKVGGIPSFVIVDAENGELCTTNGRDGVSEGAEGLTSFPWKLNETEPEPDFEPEPDLMPESEFNRGVQDLALGEEVQLHEDPAVLRAAFARFFANDDGGDAADGGTEQEEEPEEEGGGWSAEVEQLAREAVGVIVEVWEPDRSVTLRLVESGELLECPFEAIARKTGQFDSGFDWARANYSMGQTVQLIGDPEAFRDAFSRFDGDEDGNDWSPEKQVHLGAMAKVVGVFDDKTLSLQFNSSDEEEVQVDFPFEAIDLDITTQLGVAIAGVQNFQCIPCGPAGRVLV